MYGSDSIYTYYTSPFLYSLVICDSLTVSSLFIFFPEPPEPQFLGILIGMGESLAANFHAQYKVLAVWESGQGDSFVRLAPFDCCVNVESLCVSYMPLKVQTHCPSFSIFVAKLIKPIAEMTSSVRLMEVSSTWLRPTAAILLSWDVLSNGEKSSSPDSQLITAILATLQSKVRGTSLKSCIFPGFS